MNSQTVSETREPLLNNLLKLFMFAMVLANIAGEMYGSILPLYLKDLNASVVQIGLFFTLSRCECGADWFILYPLQNITPGSTDLGRMDFRLSGTATQYCLG